MDLGFGLRLEQNQKLIMTPELRQAIKILQLSSLELTDYVNQMILDNPLIEVEAKDEEPIVDREKAEPEIDWEEYLQDIHDQPGGKTQKEEKKEVSFENMVTRGVSLQEHLLSQLGLLSLAEVEKRVARYLIGNIDSVGYLAVSLEQAAKDTKLPLELIEHVLEVVQCFDPPGVGARCLRECLLIQLKQKGINSPEMFNLVENHLESIAAGKLNRLAQILSLPVTRVQEMADLIKSLNPKPGAAFGDAGDVRYIVPDIFVERIDGDYIILVNDSHIPHLTINKTYSAILRKNSNADEKTKGFVESKLNQAMWLIRSIEQRRMTIYQVTAALVKMQKPFFDHGIKYLKPMTLRQIAEKINVHESTVSRATANKYIQTPHGVFEYKFFFSAGLNTCQGESASSESIKRMLQEIIKEEDATRPYSDQKLASILQSQGINIARRTVSKYREELGIPSTGFRRRY